MILIYNVVNGILYDFLFFRSFPSEVRGRIAGLAKAYFGISAAVLASIAGGFFPSASVHFILFVAIVLPSFLIVGALNVNVSVFRLYRYWPT
jgi:hypothetical protein